MTMTEQFETGLRALDESIGILRQVSEFNQNADMIVGAQLFIKSILIFFDVLACDFAAEVHGDHMIRRS